MDDDGLYLRIKAKVKAATKAVLVEPDWAANMELVDLLNTRHSYAEYISRVLKKRIRHWNPTVGFLALTLTEALVKNCSCFHPYVADPDFIDSMLKELYRKKPKKTLLQKVKVQAPHVSEIAKLQRRDKILLLIESWGKSFADSTSYPIFRETYHSLLRDNFRFPQPMKDEISPVFTPAEKPRVLPNTDTSGPIKDYTLQNVLANVELFMDTLNETRRRDDLRANDTVQALFQNMTQSQNDVMARINDNPSEELMAELLMVNDEICQAINFYNGLLDGTMKRRKAQKHKPSSNKQSSLSDSFDNKMPAAAASALVPSYNGVEDLLGLDVVVAPPLSTPSNSNAVLSEDDSEPGSEYTDDYSESDAEESEEESEEESGDDARQYRYEDKPRSVPHGAIPQAIAPPPSAGKGKTRRIMQLGRGGSSDGDKQVVTRDPWAMQTSGVKIEAIDDDPFGAFAQNPPKQIAAPAAPLQIAGPPQSSDEFLQIALREMSVVPHQGASNGPAPKPTQANPFDPF